MEIKNHYLVKLKYIVDFNTIYLVFRNSFFPMVAETEQLPTIFTFLTAILYEVFGGSQLVKFLQTMADDFSR